MSKVIIALLILLFPIIALLFICIISERILKLWKFIRPFRLSHVLDFIILPSEALRGAGLLL
jgi:hypothetical protein